MIHAHHVTASSGSGLVHCAPAHGAEDYHAFLAQSLLSKAAGRTDVDVQEILCLVGSDGTFSEGRIKDATWLDETVGKRLKGKHVISEGSIEVAEILKEAGNLVKEEDIKHRYPYDWKTNSPIIVT